MDINNMLLLFGGATTALALLTYFHLRKADRRKTTFDALNSQIWDSDYITARNLFTDKLAAELRILDQKGIGKLLERDNKDNLLEKTSPGGKSDIYTTKVEVLKMIINSNELIATGVRLGTLDERLLYLQTRGSYINDWNILCEFIDYVRRSRGNDFVGIEFETLAKKWKGKPRRPMNGLLKFLRNWPQP